jgi:hypothetical protein
MEVCRGKWAIQNKEGVTSHIFGCITVPNKLGPKLDEVLHHRLQRASKNKFRREKTRQMIKDRLAKQNSKSRRKRRLTSSKAEVEEPPATIA